MQDVVPPGGTPFIGSTQGLLATAAEETALEELLGVVATEEEYAEALELGLGLLVAELLEITVLPELLEGPEPPELGSGFSLLEQAKKTPLIAKASKNKIPNALFINLLISLCQFFWASDLLVINSRVVPACLVSSQSVCPPETTIS